MVSTYSKPLPAYQIIAPKQSLLLIYTKQGLGNLKYQSRRLTLHYPAIDSQILLDLSECNLGSNSHFFKMSYESSWFSKQATAKPEVSLDEIAKAFTPPIYSTSTQDINANIVSRELSDLFQVLKTTREHLRQSPNSSAILFLADLCCRIKESHSVETITQTISYLERILQHSSLFKGWSTTDTTLYNCVIYTLGKLISIHHLIKTSEQKDSAIDILKEIKHHLSQTILVKLLSATIRLSSENTQPFLITTYFEVKHQKVSPDMSLSPFIEINTFTKSELGAYLAPLLEEAYPILNENNEFAPNNLSEYYRTHAFSPHLSGLHPVCRQKEALALRQTITQLIFHLNTLLHLWKEASLLAAIAQALGNDKFYSVLSRELPKFCLHFINLRERIAQSCKQIEHIGLRTQNHSTAWTVHSISTWSRNNFSQARQLFQQAEATLNQCSIQIALLLLKQRQHAVENTGKSQVLLEELKTTQSEASSLLGLDDTTQQALLNKLPSELELANIIQTQNTASFVSHSPIDHRQNSRVELNEPPAHEPATLMRFLTGWLKLFKFFWNLLFYRKAQKPTSKPTISSQTTSSEEIISLSFNDEKYSVATRTPIQENLSFKSKEEEKLPEKINTDPMPSQGTITPSPDSPKLASLRAQEASKLSIEDPSDTQAIEPTKDLSLDDIKTLALRFLAELLTKPNQKISQAEQERFHKEIAAARQEDTLYCRLMHLTKHHKAICNALLEQAPYHHTLKPKLSIFQEQQKKITNRLLSASLNMGIYRDAAPIFFSSPYRKSEEDPTQPSFIHTTNNSNCICTGAARH